MRVDREIKYAEGFTSRLRGSRDSILILWLNL